MAQQDARQDQCEAVFHRALDEHLDAEPSHLYSRRMNAPHLGEILDLDLLDEMLSDGYVSVTEHPTLPLRILNYTPAAQYERMWNEVTAQCRGLIVDEGNMVVARPFSKFFNYGETDQYDELPTGDPIVSEKMDGSLGIIYTYNTDSVHHTAVATRGSFTSDQAKWASDWLWTNLPDFAQPEGVTTLVEIIYPQNRIVVDYGTRSELVLLGAVLNTTGQDIDLNGIDWWGGSAAEMYPYFVGDVDIIAREVQGEAGHDSWADGEGVVLCWPRSDGPSFRLKVKHPRYVELHRIVTGLSTRTVHEALSNGTFDDLLANVPDEFHPWLRQVSDDLTDKFNGILVQARRDLNEARLAADALSDHSPRDFDFHYSRKDLATYLTTLAVYPGLCFSLEDGKNISDKIWSMLRPERVTAMILEDSDVSGAHRSAPPGEPGPFDVGYTDVR